ncbi:hypothetical protein [Ktedonospora formicarum]|nr:hypothetical protein [Ktedonospora formicarum]
MHGWFDGIKSVHPMTIEERRDCIAVARGRKAADTVLRNARVVNVFSHEIYLADVAIRGDRIAGIGPQGAYDGQEIIDCGGHYLVPGLIEAHTHVEDSLLVPGEFARPGRTWYHNLYQ